MTAWTTEPWRRHVTVNQSATGRQLPSELSHASRQLPSREQNRQGERVELLDYIPCLDRLNFKDIVSVLAV